MKVGFDLDGVLLDSPADLSWLDRGLDAALEELGFERTDAHRRKLYPDALDDLEAVATEFGVSPDRLWDVRTRQYTESKVRAITTGEIRPFEDIDAIDRLSEETLFCVSNSPQAVVDAFFETTDLRANFDVIVGRGQSFSALERCKPEPSMFDPVEGELGDGEYVYVGDRESDRTFAARTGMGYVHLDRRERSLADVIGVIETGTWEHPSRSDQANSS